MSAKGPMTLLCEIYGHELVIDPSPGTRADALGARGASIFAQICENNVVAVINDDIDALYCVSHEIAHGIVWRAYQKWTEQDVFIEQCRVLVAFAKWLTQTAEIR